MRMAHYSKFTDTNFHKVLERNKVKKVAPNGISEFKNIQLSTAKEWFNCSSETIIKYLDEYKEGKITFTNDVINKIELREEQKEACEKIGKAWNKALSNDGKSKKKFLLDAIMRFGKCITTYSFINQQNISKTLILTHRPVVENSWFDDFKKIFKNEYDIETYNKKYEFYKKDDNVKILDKENFIYFASIQDMRGVDYKKDKHGNYILDENGDKQFELNEQNEIIWKESNKNIFEINWDLVVIDEAHEGNLTSLAKKMHNSINKKFSLFLSGTPFNLLSEEFEDEFGKNYYHFGFEDEQRLKKKWSETSIDSNPYFDLPDLKLSGISIEKENLIKNSNQFENNYFNFDLFFELNDDGSFKNKEGIKAWLDNITSDNDNDDYLSQMPFHKSKRFHTKHSLWLLPKKVEIANALEKLLNEHEYFKKYNYQIFNVAGNNYDPSKDFSKIQNYTNDENKQSIILTIGRLTQGITLPGLSTILMLDNTTSPIKYFQTIFRAKSQSPKNWKKTKTAALIFDFNPDRCLDIIYQMALKASNKKGHDFLLKKEELDKSLKEVLNFLDVMGYDNNEFKKIDWEIFNNAFYNVQINRIVNQGFDAPKELIDVKKLGIQVSNNKENLTKFFDSLLNRFSSTKAKDKVKLTDNGLDQVVLKPTDSLVKEIDKELKEPVDENKKTFKDNLNKLKNIIKNIFPRIPYMLIGKLNEIKNDFFGEEFSNFNIDKFCNLYDASSWKEIMPHTFEKNEFKQIVNDFIDNEKFIRTCQAYIKKINEISEIENNNQRCDTWFSFFDSLHSFDRETVFTPLKVVQYQVDSLNIDWKEAYLKKQTFIDINVKTSLYPLYIAKKLLEVQLEIEKKSDWRKIVYNQIFAICKLDLIKEVVLKVLNFKNDYTNVLCIDIVDKVLENNKKSREFETISNEIMSRVKRPKLTKFDYCISNPPYQVPVVSEKTQDNSSSANVIFDKFVLLGKEIANITCMIFPAKWMVGGKGLNEFRRFILNSKNIEYLIDCENYKQLFPTITLHSGLSILTINMLDTFEQTKVGYFNDFQLINKDKWKLRLLNEYGDDIFIIDDKKYKILKKIEKTLNIKDPQNDWKNIDTMDNHVQPINTFNLGTNFYKKNNTYDINEDFSESHDIKVYYITAKKEGRNKNTYKNRTFGYISNKFIDMEHKWIKKYKVCLPKAGGG